VQTLVERSYSSAAIHRHLDKKANVKEYRADMIQRNKSVNKDGKPLRVTFAVERDERRGHAGYKLESQRIKFLLELIGAESRSMKGVWANSCDEIAVDLNMMLRMNISIAVWELYPLCETVASFINKGASGEIELVNGEVVTFMYPFHPVTKIAYRCLEDAHWDNSVRKYRDHSRILLNLWVCK